MACGKTAEDRFGMEGEASPGWDASCMLNAKLYFRSMLKFSEEGRVEEIVEPELPKPEKIIPPKVRKAKVKVK